MPRKRRGEDLVMSCHPLAYEIIIFYDCYMRPFSAIDKINYKTFYTAGQLSTTAISHSYENVWLCIIQGGPSQPVGIQIVRLSWRPLLARLGEWACFASSPTRLVAHAAAPGAKVVGDPDKPDQMGVGGEGEERHTVDSPGGPLAGNFAY